MGPGTTSLSERARSIFSHLGYTLDGDGAEFRAERDWKSVHVMAVDHVPEPPENGDLRCFVTTSDTADPLRDHLLEAEPAYDWAIIAVDETAAATDGGYDVIHPPNEVVA